MHGKKHSAKNSHSQSWGSWSDWKWNQQEQRYYCERFDWQGNVEYRWGPEAFHTNDHQRTPRTEGAIDQLTTGFGGLDVNSSGYDHDQGIAYSDQGGSPTRHSTAGGPASPLYTHDTLYNDNHDYSHSHVDKGKGISNTTSYDYHYDEGQSRHGSVPPTTNSYAQGDYHDSSAVAEDSYGRDNYRTDSYGRDDYERDTTSYVRNSSGASGDSYYPQSSDYDNTDYELQQALKNSRDESFGGSRVGGPSTSGDHYSSTSILPGTYELDASNSGEVETTPRGTPIPTQSDFIDTSRSDYVDTSIIRGTPGNVEPVDHRFVVENSYKFQPGEVFKILWSEPTGQQAGDASISDIRAVHGAGGQFYIGYRRFIIVSTDESHHSTCVPILTYDRRGCSKKGVRPSKHGVIYPAGGKPRLLRNEPELGFEPVPLEIYAEGEILARESRVNYSKLVTIEHNVKVFFIGRIPYPHFDNVSYAVDKCWNEKNRKSNKKSRR